MCAKFRSYGNALLGVDEKCFLLERDSVTKNMPANGFECFRSLFEIRCRIKSEELNYKYIFRFCPH
jgi:hypothetical protein